MSLTQEFLHWVKLCINFTAVEDTTSVVKTLVKKRTWFYKINYRCLRVFGIVKLNYWGFRFWFEFFSSALVTFVALHAQKALCNF